jgi:hypothetical protein
VYRERYTSAVMLAGKSAHQQKRAICMSADITEPPVAGAEFEGGSGHALFVKDATAPGEARTWVGRCFAVHGRADVVPDAQMLVSELVTNALREEALFTLDGKAVIRVTITPGPDAYRVGVYDGNPDPPPTPPELPTLDAEEGRGLVLVDAIAARWGSTPFADPASGHRGKCVWFEVATGAAG